MLCLRDTTLGLLIKLIEDVSVSLDDDYYNALVQRIVAQQLSIQAARTIYGRLVSSLGRQTPIETLLTSDDTYRSLGVSLRKISYLKDLATKVLSREIDLAGLNHMDDSGVISHLTQVKGIGQWTAEMFLIFSLGRTNVLSAGDVALCRAVQWLYHGTIDLGTELFDRWSPYNTIASLYLWESINSGYVDRFKSVRDALNSRGEVRYDC